MTHQLASSLIIIYHLWSYKKTLSCIFSNGLVNIKQHFIFIFILVIILSFIKQHFIFKLYTSNMFTSKSS